MVCTMISFCAAVRKSLNISQKEATINTTFENKRQLCKKCKVICDFCESSNEIFLIIRVFRLFVCHLPSISPDNREFLVEGKKENTE
jgi:hypothetical protein